MAIKIHPSADVQSNFIGDGTSIWQNCVILQQARIGLDCNINFNVFIENDVIIGDSVTIKPGVQIWDGLRIRNNVFIGPNVTFTNDPVPRSRVKPIKLLETLIYPYVSISANSTILAGITIGQHAFIGAGSVVTKNIPAFTVWYGNPPKHKGYITIEGVILNLDYKDKNGKKYAVNNRNEISTL